MDRKTTYIILSLALIVAFFLPYFTDGVVKISGYKLVFGNYGSSGSAIRFLWLGIPIVGLLILLTSLGTGPTSNDQVSWIPLVILIIFIIRTFFFAKTVGSGHVTFSDYLKTLGVGYWITFVSALLLA